MFVLVGYLVVRSDPVGLQRGTTTESAIDSTPSETEPLPPSTAATVATTDTTTSSSATTEPPPPDPVLIDPVSIAATNVRAAVPRLRCGGSNDFRAEYLLDGDPQTGWGASAGDGTNQRATIDLGARHRLTRIGLTPGYLRVAKRSDQGCAEVSAFEYNRFVEQVTYTFSDGSEVTQRFALQPTVQYIDVDVITDSITVTIDSTRSTNSDDDTILSDIEVWGHRP